MRRILWLLMVPWVMASMARPVSAAPHLTSALLMRADLPAGWDGGQAWEVTGWPVCGTPGATIGALIGQYIAPGLASVEFSQSGQDGWFYRGVQQAVIELREGSGPVVMEELRARLAGCELVIPEPDGLVFGLHLAPAPDPALGSEAIAVTLRAFYTLAERSEPETEARGSLIVMRRAAIISILVRLDGAAPAREPDIAFTDRLARLTDRRLAMLTGTPLPVESAGGGFSRWRAVVVAFAAAAGVTIATAAAILHHHGHGRQPVAGA